MKILLIAYSFPPLIDAQSLRWYDLVNVKDLYEYSWEKKAQRIYEHLMKIW